MRFDFAGSNDRELPLILGLMPVLAKHAVKPETFEETIFEAPLGSGPYVVGAVDPGKSVTFKRNPNYWGRDLAITRGFWNFDEIKFDYYRDANSHLEAFKRGLYDLRNEHDPTRWQTGYDFPALREGRVLKEALPTGVPKVSSYYVFNTRRPIFSDIRVREAISLLFDFEWVNHSYFFDLYRRTASYFEGSELSSHGRPADARERALLAPFADAVRADVMDGTWSPPVSDGSGRDRTTLRRALDLFAAAGYELRGAELIERQSGRPFNFEIMVATRDDERLALLFAQSLKRAGITARVRVRRCGPVRRPQARLRLRHDREPLGPVALAGQRAGLLLGLGRRRCARHPQLYGRQEPGRRRHDRRAAQGGRPGRVRVGGARARSRADLRQSTWCRCFICRRSGSRAGPRSAGRRRPRSTAIFRKPGGVSPKVSNQRRYPSVSNGQ